MVWIQTSGVAAGEASALTPPWPCCSSSWTRGRCKLSESRFLTITIVVATLGSMTLALSSIVGGKMWFMKSQ